MEQWTSNHSSRSTPSYRQTKPKNIGSQQDREPHLEPSQDTPVTGAASSSETPASHSDKAVSSSEPSLRFPRPQGNKRLANWISSSDPNIMDLAHENNSELGLSGSTYELIEKEESVPNTHHANTDSESQDDSQHEFDGSLSESIGSLDQNRQDDVQSLGSTDHLEDEEDDGFHHHYEDEHDDASTAPDDEGSHLTSMTVVDNEDGPSAAYGVNDVEELSDAESRSSIEYTRQSLGTPSVLTPEASKILTPMQDDADEVAEPTRLNGTARSVTEKVLDTWDAIKSKALNYIAVVVPPQPPSSDRKACITYQREHWIACDVRHAADVLGRNPKQIVVSTL
jgi:hypothetical protein